MIKEKQNYPKKEKDLLT